MTQDNRLFNDPIPNNPKQSDDRLWKMTFIGGINILMGIILYVVIMYSDVPINTIPGIFLCVGGAFFLTRAVMGYKSDKKKGLV